MLDIRNISQLSAFSKECDDSISNKVFIDNITLGIVFIAAYIVLALIVKPLGAGRVLGKNI